MKRKMLDRDKLETLRDNNALRGCRLIPAGAEWTLFVTSTTGEYQVAKQRSPDPKMFKSLDTACVFIRELGLGQVTIELAKWSPRQKSLAVTTKTSSAGR